MEDQEETLEVDRNIIREVKQFSYLGDMLDSESEMEKQFRQDWQQRERSGERWLLC